MSKKSLSKGTIIKIIIAVAAAAVLIAAALLFKFLVGKGSTAYLYNEKHDTRGALETLYYPLNADGADSETAAPVDQTRPSAFNIKESILVDGELVSEYSREEKLAFTEEYIKGVGKLNGMLTFRGDYTRNTSAFGEIDVSRAAFEKDVWSFNTGKVLKSNGVDYWSGNGWTGQPIAVKWSEEEKKVMNLYDDAKSDPDLVEIIYPGMDGHIHFLNLRTGKETRPDINVGMTFKGTASLYPDGHTPLLFCGSGDAQTGPFGENVSPRFYIYSMLDGKLLFEYGYDDMFAPRVWHAYDSSPIISTETDTLIYPGENGVIYTMKLNTSYNAAAGTISVNPDNIVEYTFTSDRYSEDGRLWGSESSASVFGQYLFIGDNSGLYYCLDLNSMTMVWVQDLREDINSSGMLEIDDEGNRFIYVATTLKYGYDEHSMGTCSIFKLNAMNGAVIWEKPYEVHYISGVAGGVLSTGVIGEGPINDVVIYSVSRTPEVDGGYIVALDKTTGEEKWVLDLDRYSWSSTACIYTVRGTVFLVQGCQNGDLLLIDAVNGKILDKVNFGTGIEATPVVYDDYVVFGTRSEKICAVKVK